MTSPLDVFGAFSTYAATALAALILPVPPITLWFQLFARRWRRWGPSSYWLHAPVYIGIVAAAMTAHGRWSDTLDAWPVAAQWAGVGLLGAALALLALTFGVVDVATLMSARQFGDPGQRTLYTGGIYAWVRHPRYLMLALAALGSGALFGSLSWLVFAPLVVAAVPVMCWLEERDLRSCFGERYLRYAREVPALAPKRPRRCRSTSR